MGMSVQSQFHVLAVDDSLVDRKLIERLLKTSSYQVTAVDSGIKALEFLGWHEDDQIHPTNHHHHHQPSVIPPNNLHQVDVNLIITDYCMPGMTGYDLLKKIKKCSSLRNIPVVIMSSENVPARISRCLEEGAEEFFLKPVSRSDVNKLMSHITTMLSKQSNLKNQEEDGKEEDGEVKSDIQMQQHQQYKSNKKRKSMEEGLSPDRTRSRFDSLSVAN